MKTYLSLVVCIRTREACVLETVQTPQIIQSQQREIFYVIVVYANDHELEYFYLKMDYDIQIRSLGAGKLYSIYTV